MSQELERVYTINLGKVLLSQSQHRSVRAINMIKEFARHHMKVETVKIEEDLAHQVWARGIRSPPRKIRVRMSKTDEGYVLVSQYDEELEPKVTPEKETPKVEEKVETPAEETKVEAEVAEPEAETKVEAEVEKPKKAKKEAKTDAEEILEEATAPKKEAPKKEAKKEDKPKEAPKKEAKKEDKPKEAPKKEAKKEDKPKEAPKKEAKKEDKPKEAPKKEAKKETKKASKE